MCRDNEGVHERATAVARVLTVIPAGKVLTYGDVAELSTAGGPRQVAAVLARGEVPGPWWRVVRADGSLPSYLWPEAHAHYRDEGTPMRDERVDMAQARWSPPLSVLDGQLGPCR